MSAFADLHRGDEPLLLPNAWDHASARALADQGFRAIGTTSLGVAAAAGLPDGTSDTRDETLRLALALGSDPYLLSVDAEDGYSQDPDEVGKFARELAAVGAIGINLEDRLGSVALHAAKIEAVKAAAPGLFVNARTDTYWLGDGEEDSGPCLDAYQQAGSDGVFVPDSPTRRTSPPCRSAWTSPSTSSTPRRVPPSPTWPTSGYAASASARCSTDGRWVRRWRRSGRSGKAGHPVELFRRTTPWTRSVAGTGRPDSQRRTVGPCYR